MKWSILLAFWAPLLVTDTAWAVAPVSSDCVVLDENCGTPSTDPLATRCGTGSYAAPKKSSYVTLGSGVTSVTLVQCKTGDTMTVTADTDFCNDLPSGWNDNVCEVDVVTSATCPSIPSTGCTTSSNAKLTIKDAAVDRKDKLTWKWSNGPALTQASFGDPTTSTAFDVCVYSNNTLKTSSRIPAGTLWTAIRTSGYKFKDGSNSYAGIGLVGLSGGDSSKITVKAKGLALPAPFSGSAFFDTTTPVKIQLVSSGACFESEFASSAVSKNEANAFGAEY